MTWLGVDIGGANIKIADGKGFAQSVPFQLWRQHRELSARLRCLVNEAPTGKRFAVSMTGELADCYESKTEGVRHIISSLHEAAGDREIRVFLVDGRFVSTAEAADYPKLAAASNWLALAEFACRHVNGTTGILIDVGSTTTDLIPLTEGHPTPKGRSDSERLMSHELVYMGVGRTPICAITVDLPWREHHHPRAAELFATTADAYVILGEIAEESGATWTADGRPLTSADARRRLARMLCMDLDEFAESDALRIADYIRFRQYTAIAYSLRYLLKGLAESPQVVVSSGSGEFLLRYILHHYKSFFDQSWQPKVVSLTSELGYRVSCCAPAHALAVLASEMMP